MQIYRFCLVDGLNAVAYNVIKMSIIDIFQPAKT